MRIKSQKEEINKLVTNILSMKLLNAINCMINDYSFLYNKEELLLLKKALSKIESYRDIETINTIEEEFKPLVFRTWEYEEEQGNSFVHWLKKDKINNSNPIISTTFGNVDTFCNSVIGVKYKTDINGFLGACEKDGATIIESNDKQSIYTIKTLEDGRVVNSYNLSTPIYTPKQAMENLNNNYKSKHNEILLDAKYATPIEIICIDDDLIYLADEISKKHNIPFQSNAKMI